MNLSKLSFIVSLLIFSTAGFAGDTGGGSTGGGDHLSGSFVRRALHVVEIIGSSSQIVVSADVLKRTIQKTLSVRVVDRLINPCTNQPITEKFEAYACLGKIVLLSTAPWDKYLSDDNYNYLVAHELLRAAGYDDEGYKISLATLKLGGNKEEKLPANYQTCMKRVFQLFRDTAVFYGETDGGDQFMKNGGGWLTGTHKDDSFEESNNIHGWKSALANDTNRGFLTIIANINLYGNNPNRCDFMSVRTFLGDHTEGPR